jgi:hypothetical protein
VDARTRVAHQVSPDELMIGRQPLRWAQCSTDQHPHLLDSAGVTAGEDGKRVALGGRLIWPERHTFSSESRGAREDCVGAGRAW